MGSLERKLKREQLKKYTKEKEKEMQENNKDKKVKGLPFSKYWQQYQKTIKNKK